MPAGAETLEELLSKISSTDFPLENAIPHLLLHPDFHSFSQLAQGKLRVYDDKIQEICCSNAKMFVDSMDRIQGLEPQLQHYHEEVQTYFDRIQKVGTPAAVAEDLLQQCYQINDQVQQNLMQLQHYQVIIGVIEQLQEQIQDNQYYQALHLIQYIQQQLPTIKIVKFQQLIKQWIALQYDNVQSQTQQQLNLWILKTPTIVQKIGHETIHAYARTTKEVSQSRYRFRENILAQCQEFLVNLHVLMFLDDLDNFRDYYQSLRMKQFTLANIGDINPITTTYATFQVHQASMIEKVIGTFVLESLLIKAIPIVLIPQTKLNRMFEAVSGEMIACFMKFRTEEAVEAKQWLVLKSLMIDLIQSLTNSYFNYPTHSFVSFFSDSHEYFLLQLSQQAQTTCNTLFETQTFEVAVYSSSVDYHQASEYGWDIDLSVSSSPDFTKIVLSVCDILKGVVDECLEYAKFLRFNAWTQSVWKILADIIAAVNQLFVAPLDSAHDIHVSQAVQIASNASYVAKFCRAKLDKYVKEQQQVLDRIEVTCNKLCQTEPLVKENPFLSQAEKSLVNTTVRAQDSVCELMIHKIQDLLGSLEFINWMPKEPAGCPHSCITDLIEYLQVTFMCLTNLPQPVRESAHFASCSCIHNLLTETICSSRVKQVNASSLKNMQLDVEALVDFANECGIHQLNECFTPLGQLLDFMLSSDCSLDIETSPELRERYPQLQKSTVLVVLEKYVANPPTDERKQPQSKKKTMTLPESIGKKAVGEVLSKFRNFGSPSRR